MSILDELIMTKNKVIAKSYAKINLTLDVLGKRDNGYHDVEMIMQTVGLFDLIIVEKIKYSISVSSNLTYLPSNDKNIAYQSALAFFKYTGLVGGVKIELQKNIPVSAGLAGGSGNAAAVLCAMNLLFNTNLSYQELCEISATLGADVPYCINGGTQLAQGIGEKLSPISPMPIVDILLVKPPISVSTATIYQGIDNSDILKRPNTTKMISSISTGNIDEISSNLCNVMETVTQSLHPIIGGIKEKMILNGAKSAIMCGSGPTVFGIFTDSQKAIESFDSFSLQFKEVFLTKIKN